MNLEETLKALHANPEYRLLTTIPGVLVDLKYACADNFMGKDVYGPFREAFLHRVAADQLEHASRLLRERHPDWSFLVYDALRPRSIQRVLWAHVVGTAQQGYVADPDQGSVHGFGLAVDLTITDGRGRALDMGTPFDGFEPLSQPKLEEQFLQSGELSPAQHANRLLLRGLMTQAGFHVLPHEWWHFDALPRQEIRASFAMIE